MKKSRFLLPIAALAGLALLWLAWPATPPALPLPTDRAEAQREDEAFKEARAEWVRQMHRAAPGTDWEAMDRATRYARAEARFRQWQTQGSRTTSEDYPKDTLAGGLLRGHWREAGSSNQAGRIHLAEYDPATDDLYLASAGGQIWRGDLQGNSWQVQNDLLRIPDIQFLRRIALPGGGYRLLAASGAWGENGFRYSLDDGHTWIFSGGLANVSSWGRVLRAVVTPGPNPEIYLLALEWDNSAWEAITTVYRSTDFGTTFSPLASLPNSQTGGENRLDLWTDRFRPGPVCVLENQHLYYVDANGQLSLQDTLPLTQSPNEVRLTGRVDSTGSVHLYALYRESGLSHIYRRSPSGSWTYTGNVGSDLFFRNSFACDLTDPNRLYVGGIDAYRSANGGQSWQLVNAWWEYYSAPATKLHADIPSFDSYLDPSGQPFTLISTDGGIYISRDQLQTVQNISLQGLHVSQYYSTLTHATSPGIVYAGSQDQGYQRSLGPDTGQIKTFDQLISGDYGHLVSGDGGQSLWMNYPGFTRYYPNAALSGYGFDRDFDGSGHLWLAPLLADPTDPQVAYLGGGSVDGQGAQLIRLTASNNTISIQEQSFDFSLGTNASISAMAISPLNPAHRYVLTDNTIFFYSTDGGQSWQTSGTSALPGSHYFYGNAIWPSPVTPGLVYIAGSGYSNAPVYVSTNHGQTFTALAQGLPNTLVYDLAGTPEGDMLFAATEVGPYLFLSSTGQWYPMDGMRAPEQTYWSVEYVPALRAARFGTYGRGIWDFFICDAAAPAPVAAFDMSVDSAAYALNLTNTSTGAWAYQWEISDGTVSSSRDLTHSLPGPGGYIVRLKASTACRTTSALEQVLLLEDTTTTALGTPDLPSLRMYPNPSRDQVQVDLPSGPGPWEVRVMDLQGRLRQRHTPAATANGRISLSLGDLPAGTYLVEAWRQGKRAGHGRVVRID